MTKIREPTSEDPGRGAGGFPVRKNGSGGIFLRTMKESLKVSGSCMDLTRSSGRDLDGAGHGDRWHLMGLTYYHSFKKKDFDRAGRDPKNVLLSYRFKSTKQKIAV